MNPEPENAACPECGCVGGDECEHLNCPCWTPKNAASQRFLEDRDGHLWLMAVDGVLIEWSPRARDYIESTKGPLTEWSDPSANA